MDLAVLFAVCVDLVRDILDIEHSGAIRVGSVCIDGHSEECMFRVVTHVHMDHILGLEKSVSRCRAVIATPITMDLLLELGYNIPASKRLVLDYDTPAKLDGDTIIMLKYAHHIAGTAQVVVGYRDRVIAYTSDFRKPGSLTPIVREPDVLVIDATYGDPRFRRPSEESIIEMFVDLVSRLVKEKPVHIYAYYGKAQEVVSILRSYGIDVPILLSYKQWRILKVLEKHGYRYSDVYLDGTLEAREIRRDGWYLYIEHFSKFETYKRIRSVHHVLLTGWLFSNPMKRVSDNVWIVALSDHADFDDTLLYVEESKPRLLVVDASRGGVYAYTFAKYVEQNLGIRALALP